MSNNHISIRPSKKHPSLKGWLLAIAKKKDRSLNYIIEQALVEYANKNGVSLVELMTPYQEKITKSHQAINEQISLAHKFNKPCAKKKFSNK